MDSIFFPILEISGGKKKKRILFFPHRLHFSSSRVNHPVKKFFQSSLKPIFKGKILHLDGYWIDSQPGDQMQMYFALWMASHLCVINKYMGVFIRSKEQLMAFNISCYGVWYQNLLQGKQKKIKDNFLLLFPCSFWRKVSAEYWIVHLCNTIV